MNKEKMREKDLHMLEPKNFRNMAPHEYMKQTNNYLNDKMDGYYDALEITIINMQKQIDKLIKENKRGK